MIDSLALGLSHGLLMLTAWRLMTRRDLNDPAAPAPERRPKGKPGWTAPDWTAPDWTTPDWTADA